MNPPEQQTGRRSQRRQGRPAPHDTTTADRKAAHDVITTQQTKDNAWHDYCRWAIPPLMTREQYDAREERIARMAREGTLPTNPYEW